MPGITAVRLITPGTTSAEPATPRPQGTETLTEAVRRILGVEVNPAIAAH